MNSTLEKFKPAVLKPYLMLLSGLMWFGVGVMLNTFAANWLIAYGRGIAYLYAGLGFIAALIIHHFGVVEELSNCYGDGNVGYNASPLINS